MFWTAFINTRPVSEWFIKIKTRLVLDQFYKNNKRQVLGWFHKTRPVLGQFNKKIKIKNKTSFVCFFLIQDGFWTVFIKIIIIQN